MSNQVNEEGRSLSAIFLRLPSKSHYPDYYHIIKSPISLKMIKNKKYTSAADFRNDFLVMFKNAQTYNMEGSEVYRDALELQNVFEREFQKFFEENIVSELESTRNQLTPSTSNMDTSESNNQEFANSTASIEREKDIVVDEE